MEMILLQVHYSKKEVSLFIKIMYLLLTNNVFLYKLKSICFNNYTHFLSFFITYQKPKGGYHPVSKNLTRK